MNTRQLLKCIDSDGILRRECEGVYPANKIPKPYGYPFAVIVNLDKHTEPGSHWVCIFMNRDGESEFFDSYGRKPDTNEIQSYMKKYATRLRCNEKQLQGPYSSACGQYCLYYMYHRLRNYTMNMITEKFGSDYDKNDTYVTRWVNDKFPVDTNVYEVDVVLNQLAHSLYEKQ